MMFDGIGLGLRHPIADELFAAPPAGLRWLELHPENYLARGGRYASLLSRARERFPLLTHGLSMGFGSLRPFDATYLRKLRELVRELDCPWHSDHLCFSSVDGVYLHDLLPLPHSHEAIEVAVARIGEARAALGVPIAVEHISYYAMAPGGELDEADHLREILERADARLLLDVNNVFVNASNHGFDARSFIDRLPLERVVQLHVAGHHVRADGMRIDTHAEPVCEEVYALFEYTMRKLSRPLPVLLERDEQFPPFAELAREVERLDQIYRAALADVHAPLMVAPPPCGERA
ncbi:MAG: hypothetical protein JWN04_5979 [Myxococcaceae bacterium]|nr:hypothetical protein [Myxococcaceae bacterium]